MQEPDVWLAVASTLALVGVAWQLVLALRDGIESMDSFLATKNALMAEERERIRSSVPRWRVGKRRRELAAVEGLPREALTESELRTERRFDRQGYAWAVVLTGALIATIASWFALLSGKLVGSGARPEFRAIDQLDYQQTPGWAGLRAQR
ncbi:hypothetical protein [Agromyces sp. NPDC058104]|uniref:hypothetical protein n=1 Tax=Agromyces sp. NPDC058104 TaxID=3346342 RepID=UPI0036DB6BA0